MLLDDEAREKIKAAEGQATGNAQTTIRLDVPVVIDADKGSRYEDVIGVLDRLQQGGVKRVGLLARPTPS